MIISDYIIYNSLFILFISVAVKGFILLGAEILISFPPSPFILSSLGEMQNFMGAYASYAPTQISPLI